MNVLIVLAHPEARSFNGAMFDTAVRKFRGKRALLALTTGAPEQAYLKGGFNGDSDAILRPVQRGVLEFLGFDASNARRGWPATRGGCRRSTRRRPAWIRTGLRGGTCRAKSWSPGRP